MSESAADEWIRRIELYLELGSDGVVVLVDKARDALIGNLVRALVRKHPDLAIVVSPEELREVPPGSVVLYHAEPEDAERLNLIRPVLKDRGLRVVLWAQGELGSELPLRAPDLYDWISHRVECPREGAPRFVSQTLLAADGAKRPVRWEGSFEDLRDGVRDAWPTSALLRLTDADYDGLVDALSGTDNFIVIERLPVHDVVRARWAMAEARRHARVALMGKSAFPFELDAGLWVFSSSQVLMRTLPLSTRVAATVLDLEPTPVEWIRTKDEVVLQSWWATALDVPDPAVALARALPGPVVPGLVSWERIAEGRAPGVALRGWGADVQVARLLHSMIAGQPYVHAWFAAAIVEPSLARTMLESNKTPGQVYVELALWSDAPNWTELGEHAANAGEHDIAIRWDLQGGSGALALRDHVETALARASLEERRRIVGLAAAQMEHRPAWLESLDARVRCDEGELSKLDGNALALVDVATKAYIQTFLGDWHSAVHALNAVEQADDLGELRKGGLAFAAWTCDATELAGRLFVVIQSNSKPRANPQLSWWRWLPALGLVRVDEYSWTFGSSEDPARDWAVAFPRAAAERALCWLAATAHAARSLEHHTVPLYAVLGLAQLEEAFSPREHVLEGVLLLLQGRALARLGQPDRAIDKLTMAEAIVRRTTENDRHPWALMARFERDWLRARHRGGSVEDVDVVLAELREALWPEHRDLREAEKLRARL